MGLPKHRGVLLLGIALLLGASPSAQGSLLEAAVTYDAENSCTELSTAPVLVTAVPSDGCVENTTCAETPAGSSLFPATVCSISDGTSNSEFIKTTLPYLFGASPYVVVEAYQAGQSCDPTKLTKSTAYYANGKCHKTDLTTSYRATRKAEGSATVQLYADAVCGTAETLLAVSAAQATNNACDGTMNGIPDVKVYGSGATPVYLTSTISYDSADGCNNSGWPSLVTTAVTTVDTCAESTACAGSSAPFTGISCSTTLTYKDDMAAAFGSTPYLIVEKYTTGQSCSLEELMSITTYRADANCRQMSTTTSYRVTWSASDLSATLEVFADVSSCTTPATILDLTRDMIANNVCFGDIKVYGSWAIKLYLSMTMVYESRANGCDSPAVPTQLVTEMADQTSCVTSDSCIGETAPYTGTICTKPTSYQKNLGVLFGSNAYVTVASYAAGTSCNEDSSTNRSYIADTKCHRSSSTTSFRAIRKADGSATVMLYANSTSCSRGLKTFAVTADQAAGNSCAKGPTGVVDKKLFGSGATPLFLTVTSIYDSIAYDCMSPAIPVQWVATTHSVDVCAPSAGCRYAGYSPTSTVCSSTQTYQTDVAAAFRGTPFVTVERYIAGKGCSESALSSVTTYDARGNCHSSSSTTSFRASVGADDSATIEIFPDSLRCDTMQYTLFTPAAQINGKQCINTDLADIKVFTALDD
ncbi:hypothetical protein ON010_g13521 [Phytophthora cinnamomi]|nr:hypothetical protein ON010_g13521 [Phytophthora cinnamomi]